MDDAFRARVRAAAAAAWRTLLIAAAFLMVQWLLYLLIVSAKPGWALAFWGPDATWDGVRAVWFNALLVVKLTLWPLAIAALWLTLWAGQLRTHEPSRQGT